MEYITLKNSDLKVSRMCLGGWLFGGKRWGKVDTEESIATIQAALDSGISFFDTADAYGKGFSEELLGKVLEKKREEVVIATKVGVVWRDDDTRYIDLSSSHIEKACELSLKRLKTDYIDLYQLHEMDSKAPIEETGRALKNILKSGKVRYIGVSNYSVEIIQKLQAFVPVISTQSEYSLIKCEIESDIVPFAAKDGISVLAYSPLYRGLLTGKFNANDSFPETDNRHFDEEFIGEKFKENLAKIDSLKNLETKLEKKTSQIAIRWLLQQDCVDVVICGARRPEQLTENIGACGWRLLDEDLSKISQTFI